MTDLSDERRIEILRTMVRIRRFEQKSLVSFSNGFMGGWLILSIGQESIAVGIRSLMTSDDHSISGPRGLGHALAAGLDMGSCMAELFGRTNGCSQGKGGMFSMFHPAKNHWGCHATAAAQTPLAIGYAFGIKQRRQRAASVCFLGDGAVNQGVFHESLNLAGLFNLPVVFVIENNGFSMGTSEKRSSSFHSCLARRAETYDIEWDLCKNDEIDEVRKRADRALRRAREERRPTVLEIPTYRFYGFTVADANAKKYRTPEEIDYRKTHADPLQLYRDQLIRAGVMDETGYQQIDQEAKSEVLEAVEFASEGKPPEVSDITRHVYWESDHRTPASEIGQHFF